MLYNGVDNSYFVALQGAQVLKSNGELVYEILIPHSDVMKILNDAEKYKKKNKLSTIIYIDIDIDILKLLMYTKIVKI